MTREEWLQKAITLCAAHKFKPAGYKVPNLRVSVGLPYGRGSKKAIGQHWHPKASEDKVGSIFISPTINDTVQVLGTLVHEIVHGAVGNEAKHGPLFRKCAIAVGLEGKMTHTTAGADLVKYFKKIIMKKIGKYPHSKMNIETGRPDKKQTTRMIKMECECGYKCRASLTSIMENGPVICPHNMEPMTVEMPDEE